MTSAQVLPPAPIFDRLGRQTTLDGIRGTAMLLVLGHNLQWPGFAGGFLGVEVFFGLSGFLITTLLLEDFSRHGHISLPAFFLRRLLRLYPALIALVAASVLYACFTQPEVPLSRIVSVAASIMLYGSNWLILTDRDAWFGGMDHTWSLAVEMHFYLLWALLVAWTTRRRGLDLRTLGFIAIGIALGSMVWRPCLWQLTGSLERLYVGTDTRFDAVFLGAGAALLRLRGLTRPEEGDLRQLGRPLVRGVELLCLLLLLGLVVRCRQESPGAYVVGFAATGVATATLILTSLRCRDSWATQLFTLPLLGWFGRISYSLYLWHAPLGKFVSDKRLAPLQLPPFLTGCIRAAACIAVAAVSYYCLERYFLRLKGRLDPVAQR